MKLKYIQSTYCHFQQYFSYVLVSEESGAPSEIKTNLQQVTDKHDLHKVVLSTPHQRQKSNSQYFSGDLGTECIDDNPMATVAAEEICKTFIQRVILCCFISFNLSDIFTGT